MTEKLFWDDPYQTEFTASILDQFAVSGGQAVILDRTYFFANSGGQPNDLGDINSVPVLDVYYDGNRLIHLLAAPLDGSKADGTVNWKRRFDHMQQHTGQHILSAAFYRLFRAETSSFHLGEAYCSIELSNRSLDHVQVHKAEQLANDVVFSAKPISAFFVEPDAAKNFPLRKQSDLAESFRIIQIGDFDMSPCSGTHLRNSGEVGIIFITNTEKLSQSLKVSFLCGNRVSRQYAKDLDILQHLSRTLTTSFELLPDSVSKLQSEIKAVRKENSRLIETLLKAEVGEILRRAKPWKGLNLIIGKWNRPYLEVRFLAQKLSEQPNVVGILASIPEGRVVFFKNPKTTFDIRAIFQEFLSKSSAKGGGSPHFLEAGNIQTQANFDSLESFFEHSSE